MFLIDLRHALMLLPMLFAAHARADAAVIAFDEGINRSFADGRFTVREDVFGGMGFTNFAPMGRTEAYNGAGLNNLSILFDDPTRFVSVDLRKCCTDTSPSGFTVALYDAASTLLASQTIQPSTEYQTLLFDRADVSRVTFSFTGGQDVYGRGWTSAWWQLRNATYGEVGDVPEPAAWTLMIAGFGAVGVALRRRRSLAHA